MTRPAGHGGGAGDDSRTEGGDGRADQTGTALALLAGSSYGLNTPLARFAHDAGLASPVLVFIRATVFLALAALVIRVRHVPLSVPREIRFAVLMLGLTSTTLSLGYFGAVVFIPVSLAAIIFFTFPILILAISVARGDVAAGASVWAVFGIVFFGLVLVIGPEVRGLDWRGIALAALTSLSGVGQFFAAAAIGRKIDTLTAVFWSHMLVAPVSLIFVLAFGFGVAGARPEGWFAAGAICIAYGVAYVSQLLALQRVQPARAGLFFNIEPVVTVLAAMALLGERFSPVQAGGAAMVLGALAWSSLGRRRRVLT